MSGRAEIVAIGDELAHGHCIDTNSAWLAQQLEAVGFAAVRFHVVSDAEAEITAVLREAGARADVVVVTGGLGPTLDDRTREAAAAAVGAGLQHDEVSWQQITAWFARLGRKMPESNRRQAAFPVGAQPLENRWGTAPGFALQMRRGLLFSLPGVPKEMKAMFAAHVLPRVGELPGAVRTPPLFALLHVLGPSEAALGERIAAFMVDARNPAVGITASSGLLTVRVAASGADAARLLDADLAALRPLLGDDLVCEGEAPFQEVVVERLRARGLTIACAESCTAGMVASALGDVPGVSAVLLGGVVAYANESKIRDLGVPPGLIAEHGAVSEPVAVAMARGVVQRFGAQIGVSVTGVAGPDGGTADKPVGMVCFGLSWAGEVAAFTRRIPALGRDFVRRRATSEVLAALLRRLR